ncbi:protein adenylyltransferase SelO [Cognatiyoonia sp.]|uniref:protein adenylyltransferase SelO n=1 Tax=Cognatiyoonia sp. TaxID=2211652 RepID=UPI003F69955F
MSTTFPFENTYATLPAQMFTLIAPTPVARPDLIVKNDALAEELGITFDLTDLAEVIGGNKVPVGADPLAQLYAGHQFGHWNPQLGDGRAILLGEVVGQDGVRRDIQLKGSGPTPYSRNGDGRSWLGPVLREYLVSEAMHAMGVPTTRALAAVTTGDPVYREQVLPGAILARVAQSHIRVGTFQVYTARQELAASQALFEHVVARHYPEATSPLKLLDAVIARNAALVAKWMSVGFIHGVMNTDNVALSGETIDYGPCAFMDDYVPMKVFSSIDQMGRYAYGNQPRVAIWNMAQLATALVPMMPDQDAAVEAFTESVNRYPALYEAEWRRLFGRKIGLEDAQPEDDALIHDLLGLMAEDGADFTNTFANLHTDAAQDQFANREAFAAWRDRWSARQDDNFAEVMAIANPHVIPRNHQAEAVIAAGVAGDFAPFHEMLDAVTQPYTPNAKFAKAPVNSEVVTRTFCGT